MTVAFELNGQSFTALNGGPLFKFNEAISFQIECATQEEVDYYWERLSQGGDPEAQQCGWLKDKFGLSWQIVPKILPQLLTDPDPANSKRAFQAMLEMKKLDIEGLQRAFDGSRQPAGTLAPWLITHHRLRNTNNQELTAKNKNDHPRSHKTESPPSRRHRRTSRVR
jgi:hypothetical protein